MLSNILSLHINVIVRVLLRTLSQITFHKLLYLFLVGGCLSFGISEAQTKTWMKVSPTSSPQAETFRPETGGDLIPGTAEASQIYTSNSNSTTASTKGRGFFGKNEVRNIFDTKIAKTDKPKPLMGREYEVPKEEEEQKVEEKKQPAQKAPTESSAPKKNILEMTKEEFNEHVKGMAGDPDAPAVIEPNPDAPKAYQAMHACLQRGDFDCAKKYSNKYIDSQARAENLISDMRVLTEKSLREKNLIPDRNDSEQPNYEDISVLAAEQALATEEEIPAEATSKNSKQPLAKAPPMKGGKGVLSDGARTLLTEGEKKESQFVERNREKLAKSAEESVGGEVFKMLSIPEDDQRRLARTGRANLVQPDPQGAARVYFFFRPDDLDAFAMFSVLERLHKAHANDKDFIVLGFSINSMTASEMQVFWKRSKVTFPFRSGSKLAQQMGISKSSTVAILSPSSGEFVLEEGVRGFAYLDELVKMVQGVPSTIKNSQK
jgi:hypothetical protein